MAENQSGEGTQRALAVPPGVRELVTQMVAEVFGDLDDSRAVIEQKSRELATVRDTPAFEPLQIALQSLDHFAAAVRLLKTQADFARGGELFESAAEGFNRVGEEEARDLSIGLRVYVGAVLELQRMNVGRGLELFAQVKEYLEKAGDFGQKFEILIDHMEPDSLFVSGVQALSMLDFAAGRALLERASLASERVAKTYYEEGQSERYLFEGLARFYRAYYTFVHSLQQFNQFEYDRIASEEDLAREAREARELLNKSAINTVVVQNVRNLSEVVTNLLESVAGLAAIMQTIFRSTFKPDLKALMALRQKTQAASRAASSLVGPQTATLIRFCDQLSNQINNLERLAKPNKKDFGAFSGLVACGLFLPLFLAVSWANSVFQLKLDASTILSSCLVLALIGGFGVGALKFKSLIFRSGNK